MPDPMRQHWSPYIAFGNNPVNRVDRNGGQVISLKLQEWIRYGMAITGCRYQRKLCLRLKGLRPKKSSIPILLQF